MLSYAHLTELAKQCSALCTLTMLCNHYFDQVLKHFFVAQIKPIPIKFLLLILSFSQPFGTTNLFFVSKLTENYCYSIFQ